MNNQKVTKLNAKDQEIETLKKQIIYQKTQIEAARNDFRNLLQQHNETHLEKLKLLAELTKIKSHWLYKFIKRFK